MIRIGCTRKLNPILVDEALGKGLLIEDKDLLRITYLSDAELAQRLANNHLPFVFTSSHAVKSITKMIQQFGLVLKNTSAFCIEGNTSKLASESGFTVIGTASDSNQLAYRITQTDAKQLLHASANIRLDYWKTFLNTFGITVDTVEVYHKNIELHTFETVDGMIFLSPSQITGFMEANTLPPELPAFCIGETTAIFLAQQGHLNIITAEQPNEQILLNTVYHYYNQTQ